MTGVQVGDSAQLTKVISAEDVERFAEISADDNPVHLDEDYAAASRFGRRIAHGILTAGLISAVVGTKLPGHGSIYVSQSLEFTAPVYLGDELTATATVAELGERRRVTLDTTVAKADGTVVLRGRAVLIAPKEASR